MTDIDNELRIKLIKHAVMTGHSLKALYEKIGYNNERAGTNHFRAAVGTPPTTYKTLTANPRILSAKNMLSQGRSLEQTASELKYPNVAVMNNCIKDRENEEREGQYLEDLLKKMLSYEIKYQDIQTKESKPAAQGIKGWLMGIFGTRKPQSQNQNRAQKTEEISQKREVPSSPPQEKPSKAYTQESAEKLQNPPEEEMWKEIRHLIRENVAVTEIIKCHPEYGFKNSQQISSEFLDLYDCRPTDYKICADKKLLEAIDKDISAGKTFQEIDRLYKISSKKALLMAYADVWGRVPEIKDEETDDCDRLLAEIKRDPIKEFEEKHIGEVHKLYAVRNLSLYDNEPKIKKALEYILDRLPANATYKKMREKIDEAWDELTGKKKSESLTALPELGGVAIRKLNRNKDAYIKRLFGSNVYKKLFLEKAADAPKNFKTDLQM